MTALERPIRVGVVGCGAQGRVHLRALRAFAPGHATVAGLCDLDAERLEQAGADWPEARRTRDVAGLLAHGDLDLALLCTMPNTHARIAVAALQAGAHILVEKPFAMNATEAETIVDAGELVDRGIHLGTNMRYMPHAQYLRHAFASGRIGQALQCRVFGGHRDPPWWGPHYNRATSSGGVLASTLVHPLDMALYVCGYPRPVTVSVSARRVFPAKRGPLARPEVRQRYDVEDLVAGHIRFANGLALQLDGNWCDDTGGRCGFELIGSRGTLRSSPFEVLVEGDDGTVTRETPALEGTAFAQRRIPVAPDEESEPVDGWQRSVTEQDADLVLHLARGQRWSMWDRRQLLVLQRLLDACYESARRGREVEVDA